jgi:predicted phosphodiesterase
MDISLYSDIHLELAGKSTSKIINQFQNGGDVLVLAGDIGNPFSKSYNLLLKEMSEKFNKIFVVTGNHEYYTDGTKRHFVGGNLYLPGQLSMEILDKRIQVVCDQYRNVHYLNMGTVEYKNVLFVGCTLWYDADEKCPYLMNDYGAIEDLASQDGWKKVKDLHKSHVEWLRSEIAGSKQDKVIITHHQPTTKFIEPSPYRYMYGTDLDLFDVTVKLWCCGHNHVTYQEQIDGVTVWCNPIGYKDEKTSYTHDPYHL